MDGGLHLGKKKDAIKCYQVMSQQPLLLRSFPPFDPPSLTLPLLLPDCHNGPHHHDLAHGPSARPVKERAEIKAFDVLEVGRGEVASQGADVGLGRGGGKEGRREGRRAGEREGGMRRQLRLSSKFFIPPPYYLFPFFLSSPPGLTQKSGSKPH